jgi:hypothetical protein
VSDRSGAVTREGERWRPGPRELEFLHAEPPTVGGSHAIAGGVLWLRIPLPMELNHINVWLLEDGDGWMLVDTGMAEAVCREAWVQLERNVLGGRPIRRVFVTHDHPDHMGLAPWLRERHGASVWMAEHAHRSSGEFLRTEPAALGEAQTGLRTRPAFEGRRWPVGNGVDRVQTTVWPLLGGLLMAGLVIAGITLTVVALRSDLKQRKRRYRRRSRRHEPAAPPRSPPPGG